MKVNKSTLSGILASDALLKWYSELASVFKAKKRMKNGLTFLALVFCDMACTFKVVEGKDVLELCFVVDDGARPLFFALFQEFNQEMLNVVWLLVAKHCSQILPHVKQDCYHYS